MHSSNDSPWGREEAKALGRDGVAGQQIGRTRERDRAGDTGRAGCSGAEEKLVGLFFIDALLVWDCLTHARYEQ
jgi:hypothetical protein